MGRRKIELCFSYVELEFIHKMLEREAEIVVWTEGDEKLLTHVSLCSIEF